MASEYSRRDRLLDTTHGGKRRREAVSYRDSSPLSSAHHQHHDSESRHGRGREHEHHHHHHHKRSASTSSSASSSVDSEEEERTHMHVSPGEILADRYVVLSEGGKGTFGRVYLCRDKTTESVVAIKAVRKVKKYIESAEVEADILHDVNKADPSAKSLIVRFFRQFMYRGHFCIVFEALGPSLYDYIKANKYAPAPLYCVQAFADQLLTSIAFMHEMHLIHTDLKLENVLLVSRDPFKPTDKITSTRKDTTVLAPTSVEIRLIDFGGATYDWERKSSLVNTRQYRAPEVILGLGWSMPSDIWSLGCILMELYIGELLFQTHDNAEHLALMEAILGPFPDSIARSQQKEVRKYFDRHGKQRFPENAASSDSVRHVKAARRLDQLIHSRDTIFLDLIQKMLIYDPEKRITAKEALNHRFFTTIRSVKEVPRPQFLPATAPKSLAIKLGLAPSTSAATSASTATLDSKHDSSERASRPHQRKEPSTRTKDSASHSRSRNGHRPRSPPSRTDTPVLDGPTGGRRMSDDRDEYGRLRRGERGGRRDSPPSTSDRRRGDHFRERPRDMYRNEEDGIQTHARARRRTDDYSALHPDSIKTPVALPTVRTETAKSSTNTLRSAFHTLLHAPEDFSSPPAKERRSPLRYPKSGEGGSSSLTALKPAPPTPSLMRLSTAASDAAQHPPQVIDLVRETYDDL